MFDPTAGPVAYPINEFGPLMKGMIIGGLGIFHVFLAQFAIGGGMLMCYFQWLAQSGREPLARRLLDSYFRVLVLISFVIGAVTGVGMWFTAIQISPKTIGVMIDQFHWVWATEWLFFWIEVIAGYAFYRYARILNDRARMTLLVIYSIAGWGSLFWINGILAWQLTPGRWLPSSSGWCRQSPVPSEAIRPGLDRMTRESVLTAAVGQGSRHSRARAAAGAAETRHYR